MTALVITWHDKARGDFRALVDEIDADGGRHPHGAARADLYDAKSMHAWVQAILADLGPTAVKTIDLGEVEHAPSFQTIRAMALVKEAAEVTR